MENAGILIRGPPRVVGGNEVEGQGTSQRIPTTIGKGFPRMKKH
jgi:hypothetical protein